MEKRERNCCVPLRPKHEMGLCLVLSKLKRLNNEIRNIFNSQIFVVDVEAVQFDELLQLIHFKFKNTYTIELHTLYHLMAE